jgi:hypothetical protein
MGMLDLPPLVSKLTMGTATRSGSPGQGFVVPAQTLEYEPEGHWGLLLMNVL